MTVRLTPEPPGRGHDSARAASLRPAKFENRPTAPTNLLCWLFRNGRSREEFDSYLASIGAEEQAEAAQLLALVTALPQLLGQLVQQSIHETAASSLRPSGPKVKLTPDVRRQIVERVGMLHISGVRLGVAQTRAGQQFGVSKRTVQEAWQKRQQFSEQPFQTMTDVWQFLKREPRV